MGGGIATSVDEDMAAQLKAAEESGAWSTGDTMGYDEIIDPRELRNALVRGLELSAARNIRDPQPVALVGVNP